MLSIKAFNNKNVYYGKCLLAKWKLGKWHTDNFALFTALTGDIYIPTKCQPFGIQS